MGWYLYWLLWLFISLKHIVLVTEPCVLCIGDMCRLGVYIWGEGKKFHVLTKCVKKNTLLFSLGIFQWLIKSRGVNGLVFIVIALLIHFLKTHCIGYWTMCVVHRWHVQAGCIYLGEGKKFHVLTKHVKKIHYCLVWGFSTDLSNQGG